MVKKLLILFVSVLLTSACVYSDPDEFRDYDSNSEYGTDKRSDAEKIEDSEY